MKVKILLQPSFIMAFNHLMNQPVPVKAALTINSLAFAVNKKIKEHDADCKALLQKYSKKMDDDNVIMDKGAEVELNKEVQSLENVEVKFLQLSAVELGDTCLLSANQIADLGGLIKM